MRRTVLASLSAAVLKEPLFHFLLVGAALFGAYSWINRSADNLQSAEAEKIHIGAGDVRWLAENWTTQWRRAPTNDELRGLVADYVNEQLLAREARALGLEANDVIVRRRLAQKVTFLIDDTLRRAEPSEEELQRYHEANASRYRTGGRISFAHIYFSPQRRVDAHKDATDALNLLRDAGGPPPAKDLGDRLLIESEFRDETRQAIANVFGPGFAQAVFALEADVWSGPIESGYGLHLVSVSARQEPHAPSFSEVRARVLEDWRREQERLAKERYLGELRKKYTVVVADDIQALVGPAASTRVADQ